MLYASWITLQGHLAGCLLQLQLRQPAATAASWSFETDCHVTSTDRPYNADRARCLQEELLPTCNVDSTNLLETPTYSRLNTAGA